jgi:hypothetical protein
MERLSASHWQIRKHGATHVAWLETLVTGRLQRGQVETYDAKLLKFGELADEGAGRARDNGDLC